MILRRIPGSMRSHLYNPSYILYHLLYLFFSDKTLTSTDMHKLERILNPVWHVYHWMWEILGSYTWFVRINIWFHYYSDIYSFSIFYLFIFWLFCIFIGAQAFSSLGERGYSLVVVCGLFIAVAFLVGGWTVGLSGCGSWAREHKLNSCGSQAQLPCGMWDLPGSGTAPVSPALAGGFFTTEPPRKPHD